MKVHYDKKVDALYIEFKSNKKAVKQTFKLKDFFLVDVGEKGKVHGIEILNASSRLPTQEFQPKKSKTHKSK